MSKEIVGLYLAAGQSKRMGCPKLSLPLHNTSLGSLALQNAVRSNLDRIFVVKRPDDPLDWIDPSLVKPPLCSKWSPIPCNDAGLGQAHSLRCGVQAAAKIGVEAVLILLADQPFVTTEVINELLDHYLQSVCDQSELGYVAASFQEVPRPPVLFSSKLFSYLLQLKGDEGARKLFRQDQSQQSLPGRILRYKEERLFLDLDTPEEYESLLQKLNSVDQIGKFIYFGSLNSRSSD